MCCNCLLGLLSAMLVLLGNPRRHASIVRPFWLTAIHRRCLLLLLGLVGQSETGCCGGCCWFLVLGSFGSNGCVMGCPVGVGFAIGPFVGIDSLLTLLFVTPLSWLCGCRRCCILLYRRWLCSPHLSFFLCLEECCFLSPVQFRLVVLFREACGGEVLVW